MTTTLLLCSRLWSTRGAQQPLLHTWPSRRHTRLEWVLICLIHELCGTVFNRCLDMSGFSVSSQVVTLHERGHSEVVTCLREACTGKEAHVS